MRLELDSQYLPIPALSMNRYTAPVIKEYTNEQVYGNKLFRLPIERQVSADSMRRYEINQFFHNDENLTADYASQVMTEKLIDNIMADMRGHVQLLTDYSDIKTVELNTWWKRLINTIFGKTFFVTIRDGRSIDRFMYRVMDHFNKNRCIGEKWFILVNPRVANILSLSKNFIHHPDTDTKRGYYYRAGSIFGHDVIIDTRALPDSTYITFGEKKQDYNGEGTVFLYYEDPIEYQRNNIEFLKARPELFNQNIKLSVTYAAKYDKFRRDSRFYSIPLKIKLS